MIKWWALKNYGGNIIESTIAPTKTSCWEKSFYLFDSTFRDKYWHKERASQLAALKLGYKFCRVKITETR